MRNTRRFLSIEVDVLATDFRKPKEAAAVVTPASLEKGKDILFAAAKAAGGDALQSVAAIDIREEGKIAGQGADVPLSAKWLVAYPDRARADVTSRGMDVVQACDGQTAWVEIQSQTHDASPMLAEFERGLSLFGGGWGIYQQVLAGKVTGQWIGDEEIDGKKLHRSFPAGAFRHNQVVLCRDYAIASVARYQSAGPQGVPDTEQKWGDFRPVEGRRVRFIPRLYIEMVRNTWNQPCMR